MGAKLSVLGLIISFSPYLRSAMARFPLEYWGIRVFGYWGDSGIQTFENSADLAFRDSRIQIFGDHQQSSGKGAFTESAHWADSVIELQCPSVCL